MQSALSEAPLSGKCLSVATGGVRSLTTILVKELPEDASEEYILFYFESKRKSGGGPVTNVQLYSSHRCAVVSFKEEESKCLLHVPYDA